MRHISFRTGSFVPKTLCVHSDTFDDSKKSKGSKDIEKCFLVLEKVVEKLGELLKSQSLVGKSCLLFGTLGVYPTERNRSSLNSNTQSVTKKNGHISTIHLKVFH